MLRRMLQKEVYLLQALKNDGLSDRDIDDVLAGKYVKDTNKLRKEDEKQWQKERK